MSASFPEPPQAPQQAPEQPYAPQGQHPQPHAPGFPPAPAPKSNGLAVAGFVVALLGLLGSFVPVLNIGGIVLAVVGLILSIVGLAKAKKVAAGKGMALTGIILGAVAIVVGITVNVVFAAGVSGAADEIDEAIASASAEADDALSRVDGSATEDILASDLSVEMGAFEGSVDEYGLVTSALPVTLTNNASEAHSYNVHIEAVDAAGARIGDDYAMTSDLGSGQSESVELFQIVIDEEELQAYQGAEFRVVEVQQY
ncbi:FxLYD domain-containing protein [Puerhibacterium sp. TATVAM-FAB25]|uniref:FxLYD domain-containing protein n=1 Tax=Puerhibacterium sp. TATVAM-FAB25 TaxID=3093699 RepID=UPI00397C1CE9